ncbi:hypothetical protein AVEN_82865-1 [Araneus ventricosus]|uniref:Uncharacterized protein n=1 Tax=Araneus ventricosus TaxID=182803 RepID=A0A4Y2F5L4_ARAVE|nr:hypothetical protein AVEN_82865-1 [Araneus ventricosus]
MEITVDQQDDNHEVQRPTDWPVQANSTNTRLFKSLCGDMGSLHNTVAKGLSVVYGINSPTRRIMENEGLFTDMQENTEHRYRKR